MASGAWEARGGSGSGDGGGAQREGICTVAGLWRQGRWRQGMERGRAAAAEHGGRESGGGIGSWRRAAPELGLVRRRGGEG